MPSGVSVLFLIPYAISLLISCGVGLYAWRQRRVAGALPYAILAFGQASWTLGYIFELASPTLAGKIFWDNFQFIGGPVWFAGFVMFVLEYTGLRLAHPARWWALLLAIPAVLLALVYTDPLHGLIRPTAEILLVEPFGVLTYPITLVVWSWIAYGYVVFLSGMGLLIVRFVRQRTRFSGQALTIVIGNLIPMLGTMSVALDITLAGQRDISPLTFAIGNLVVAWALFRFKLFDLMPIAHEVVVESITDGIVVLDAEDRLVGLNQAARQMIGDWVGGEIGLPAAQVFAHWGELVAQFAGVDSTVQTVEADTQKGHRWFEIRFAPLHDRRGQKVGRVAIVRDVTEQQEADAKLHHYTTDLEEANRRLEALSKVKDEFVSNVSHELRTPITGIKLHQHMLALRSSADQQTNLDALNRETLRLESLVEGLLLLSRLDQDRVPMSHEDVDLNALIKNLLDDRMPVAREREILLIYQPRTSLEAAWGDPKQIEQVASILLTNAFNYTPQGGRIQVRTLTRNEDRKQVGFSIDDTGPGIPADEQEKLFTRFFRGKAGRESQVAGTGLGLAIAKEIIDRHDGRIEVESDGQPGRGSIFRVWLPVKE